MEIYIEEVIIENFILAYIVCSCTAFALKQKLCFWRKFVSSLFVTVLAVITAFLKLNNMWLLLYKFLSVYVTCYITFSAKSVKWQTINLLTYLFFGLIFGGALIVLSLSIYGKAQSSIPIYAIIFALFLGYKVIILLLKTFTKKSKIDQFTYSLKLENDGTQIQTSAFLDTGNFLVDPNSQKPVILVNFRLVNKLCGLELEDIIFKKYDCLKNHHNIEISTANKKSKILVFEIDCAVIDKSNQKIKIDNAVLGLSMAKLSQTTDCDALISSEVLSYV